MKELAVLSEDTRPDTFLVLFLMEHLNQPYTEAVSIPATVAEELMAAFNKEHEPKKKGGNDGANI